MRSFFTIILIMMTFNLSSQSYTSYFTGNNKDKISSPTGGVCLMGGGPEHDEAMKWFLKRANGGDILILRASGSDGYNKYFYSELGIDINSVETIVFDSPLASDDNYIHQKIKNAEAIWIAGGDQWDYVSYWRNTQIDSLINEGILNRNIVLGGTSAGMAILGKFYFSAQSGTVSSMTALANPYNSRIKVDSNTFIKTNYLTDVITDTHYDNRDRKGRHVVFLARIFKDFGILGKGIACNEGTAVCISPNGLATVYGDYPKYEDYAYFIQTNCELSERTPETCSNGVPLNWKLDQSALKVYKVPGISEDLNTFDLNDWETGNNGTWENWYVDNGNFIALSGTQINCSLLSTKYNLNKNNSIKVSPNPTNELVTITAHSEILEFSCFNLNGNLLKHKTNINSNSFEYNTNQLNAGFYFINIQTKNHNYSYRLIVNK